MACIDRSNNPMLAVDRASSGRRNVLHFCSCKKKGGFVGGQRNRSFRHLTATGDPRKATKKKGDAMRDALVNHLVSYMRERRSSGWAHNSEEPK
jgi:creatinine amidohydrolase/Fe(II)-dependent formamide hydrolase-like protein